MCGEKKGIVPDMELKPTTELISVIVPIYNTEKYVDKCIASIVTQSYKKLEIILVDDGSSDKSGEKCDEWALRDDRIRVIHKPNGGVSDARNTGLNMATGEYIAFVDGDDYIHENMYQKLWETTKEYDADLVICGFDMVDENGNSVKANNNSFRMDIEGRFDKKNIQKYVIKNGGLCSLVNRLYKRYLFHNMKFPWGKNFEDRMIMLSLFQKCNNIIVIKDVLYYYVQSVNSITRSIPNVKRYDLVEAYYHNLHFYEENGYPELAIATANMLIDQYVAYRNRIADIPAKDRRRIREVKKMVRSCYWKYWKHIRYLDILNIECPTLYNFLLQTIYRYGRSNREVCYFSGQ